VAAPPGGSLFRQEARAIEWEDRRAGLSARVANRSTIVP
jgi:hypothetical protein